MAYQFGHVGWSARSRTAKKATTKQNSMTTRAAGWSASDLASEAMRIDGHCAHVAEPMPPKILHGVDPITAAKEAEAWGDQAKESSGRALRRNAPVMAAGVVSFPRERIDEWPAFRDATVEALREKYGDRLRSVVEHLDEAHPHLHFYAVPKPGESFGAVHEGYKASREARGQEGNKVRTAYNDAMKGWQDWLHSAVGERFGLARIGPARERRERDEHLLARGQEQVLKDREQLAGELRGVRKERRELERKSAELDEVQQLRLEELRNQEQELKEARKAMDETAKAALAEARAIGLKQGHQCGEKLGLEASAEASVGRKIGAAWRELKRLVAGDPEREAALVKQRNDERLAKEAAEREAQEAAERVERVEREAIASKKQLAELKNELAAADDKLKRKDYELSKATGEKQELEKQVYGLADDLAKATGIRPDLKRYRV